MPGGYVQGLSPVGDRPRWVIVSGREREILLNESGGRYFVLPGSMKADTEGVMRAGIFFGQRSLRLGLGVGQRRLGPTGNLLRREELLFP